MKIVMPTTLKLHDLKRNEQDVTVTQDDKVASAQAQITEAKKNAMREIEIFRTEYEKFREVTKDLILFSDAMHSIDKLLIDELIDGIYEPVISGGNIESVPKDFQKKYRLELFKKLINHYEAKKQNN